MKATRTLALLTSLFLTFVIISCKKSGVATEASEDPAAKPKIVLVTGAPIELPDCWSTCISPEGPYIESSGSKTQTWGNINDPHWKTVNYVAYNTATSFIVKVTFTHSGGNASNDVSVTAFGSTQLIETLASGAEHTFTFDLPSVWNACDNVPFAIYQEGQNSPINMSCSYNLYAVCPADCETSFTGEAKACGTAREAEYTFVSEDAQGYFKIQGGLTNFTGTDAIVEVNGGTGIEISHD